MAHRPTGLLYALGYSKINKGTLTDVSAKSGVPVGRLKYYHEHSVIPTGSDLVSLLTAYNIPEVMLKLKMGCIDRSIEALLIENADQLAKIIPEISRPIVQPSIKHSSPNFKTVLGSLYQMDCISYMKSVESDSIDMIFADPPFNLNKLYPSNMNDNIATEEYLEWTEEWLDQCVRILKHGGSLFVWNLPKWSSHYTKFLNSRLNFRHWIGVDIKYSLPISGRLYPSHYSLLYYVKGDKANTFHPDRLPMEICPKCKNDLVDYGGYKNKMNPSGVNISDIWRDIPPVRHNKYKGRKSANELSIKLLDRIIEMSTNPGDLVLDPFGGSGTTYIVSEIKGRKWLGTELGPIDDITSRFDRIEDETKYLESIRAKMNHLFVPSDKEYRRKHNLWTDDSVKKQESSQLKLLSSD